MVKTAIRRLIWILMLPVILCLIALWTLLDWAFEPRYLSGDYWQSYAALW